jgi:hypothetical protein
MLTLRRCRDVVAGRGPAECRVVAGRVHQRVGNARPVPLNQSFTRSRCASAHDALPSLVSPRCTTSDTCRITQSDDGASSVLDSDDQRPARRVGESDESCNDPVGRGEVEFELKCLVLVPLEQRLDWLGYTRRSTRKSACVHGFRVGIEVSSPNGIRTRAATLRVRSSQNSVCCVMTLRTVSLARSYRDVTARTPCRGVFRAQAVANPLAESRLSFPHTPR